MGPEPNLSTSPPAAERYGVIYADPPWTFSTYSVKGKGRSPEAHYDCMSLEDLKKLPVGDWAAPDSVLLLWATDPLLDKAFELIRAWGFTYKTVGFYWVKLNKSGRGFFTGLGFWTRANPEPCLLATKGRPKRLASDVAKLVVSPRREHSRKPDEIYERIERLAPGPYLELFARTARPGWDAWGAEVGLFDRGEVPTRRWASNSYPNAAE
ncbi:MAG: DNA methyltransferase [Geminicoccaceae bacterium]|jgi:N6-adenosine-specific RNA methylase IME4|nr:MAG: DNA methyltransferase [Geminicoccaceae bacterium]